MSEMPVGYKHIFAPFAPADKACCICDGKVDAQNGYTIERYPDKIKTHVHYSCQAEARREEVS